MDISLVRWHREKILSLPDAEAVALSLKKEGKKIVTVNGSFDIIHAGHLDQLEDARLQGDILFVGINSDASVREGKGPGRPFVSEHDRAALLAALTSVDFVIVIDAPYNGGVPAALLRAVRPDVHVNGPDYGPPPTWVEWPVMCEVGAVGHSAPRYNDLSTSELIGRIKQSS